MGSTVPLPFFGVSVANMWGFCLCLVYIEYTSIFHNICLHIFKNICLSYMIFFIYLRVFCCLIMQEVITYHQSEGLIFMLQWWMHLRRLIEFSMTSCFNCLCIEIYHPLLWDKLWICIVDTEVEWLGTFIIVSICHHKMEYAKVEWHRQFICNMYGWTVTKNTEA